MEDVFIIDGLRTPVGRRHKGFKNVSAVNLAAAVIKALLKKNKLDGAWVDEVILGNAVGAGLGQNPARQAAICAGLPFGVPALTINKVCGSGLKSVILAAQSLRCKDAGLILAGGTENASLCPKLEELKIKDSLINDGLWCSFNDAHMIAIAEATSERFEISRKQQDEYALASYRKAYAAQQKGLFKEEIVPVQIADNCIVALDERIKDMSLDELSRMPSVVKTQGTITAGNSPAPADGAAVLALASSEAVKKFKLTPKARILGYASVAVDPELTFTAVAQAIKKCLKSSSIKLSDVDLFEIGESFAVQALLTVRELGLDTKRLNILGGTLAFGHPLGASGARGLVTLLNALQTQKKKIGLTGICLGGGCAVALAVQLSA